MVLPESIQILDRELHGIFGARLRSLIAYGLRADSVGDHGSHSPGRAARAMALVDSLTEADLRVCAAHAPAWHARGLATPLFVVTSELSRSLDAFPLEFDAIAADHAVVSGAAPFAKVRAEAADIRRACEVQARSHLLHLRQGVVEAGGNAHSLAVLIQESAAPLNALLSSVARLDGRADHSPEASARHAERLIGLTSGLAEIAAAHGHDVPAADAERLLPVYLTAMEKLVEYVDGWAAK